MPLLTVRAQEYLDYVTSEPYIGLPREEIERLHDAIPLRTDGDLQLSAYAALHHNYAWLVGLDGPGTLGKHVQLEAEGPPPTFLADPLHALARRQLEDAGLPNAPCEWRLAGLMRHTNHLSLVYVVRLHQRWQHSETRGHSELRFSRERYDAPSQLIIDHLHAF